MIVHANNDIISYQEKEKTESYATSAVHCNVVYIRKSQIPECPRIREWEKTQPSPSNLNKQTSLGKRYTIILENLNITFKDFGLAERLFNHLMGDFQDTDVTKIIPEAYL